MIDKLVKNNNGKKDIADSTSVPMGASVPVKVKKGATIPPKVKPKPEKK